jgi:hypothetical protein
MMSMNSQAARAVFFVGIAVTYPAATIFLRDRAK